MATDPRKARSARGRGTTGHRFGDRSRRLLTATSAGLRPWLALARAALAPPAAESIGR